MNKIIFTQEQVDAFTTEEREMFETLMDKAKATVGSEEGFDVKAYLQKLNAKRAADEAYRREMDAVLSGKITTQYF